MSEYRGVFVIRIMPKKAKDESKDDKNAKRQKIDTNTDETATTANGGLCVICMVEESENEDTPLQDHSCPQCTAGAWRICEECDERCLGRECPVCRQAYAPLLLHRFPTVKGLITRIQTEGINGEPSTHEDAIKIVNANLALLYKLMVGSRIALWLPVNGAPSSSAEEATTAAAAKAAKGEDERKEEESGPGVLHCLFPVDVNAKEDEWLSVRVALPLGPGRVNGGTFSFNTAVWDEMEAVVKEEEGEEGGHHDHAQFQRCHDSGSGEQVLLAGGPDRQALFHNRKDHGYLECSSGNERGDPGESHHQSGDVLDPSVLADPLFGNQHLPLLQ